MLLQCTQRICSEAFLILREDCLFLISSMLLGYTCFRLGGGLHPPVKAPFWFSILVLLPLIVAQGCHSPLFLGGFPSSRLSDLALISSFAIKDYFEPHPMWTYYH